MTTSIIFLIFLVLGLIAVAWRIQLERKNIHQNIDQKSSNKKTVKEKTNEIKAMKSFSTITAVTLLFLGVGGLLTQSFYTVDARQVGVVVEFGKPLYTEGSGLHMKAPWRKVVTLDGAVQNDKYGGQYGTDPISARLGDDSIAQVDATIQWQLKMDDAVSIYADYRDFDNIRDNLVTRNFTEAVNRVMSEYDPISQNAENETQADLAKKVEDDMRQRVGAQVEIRSVTIPLINFNDSTQARINELRAEQAKTRVAEQKKLTSSAEAEANAALQQSVTPETLTNKCLDIIADQGGSPIGCFPGTTPATVKMIE